MLFRRLVKRGKQWEKRKNRTPDFNYCNRLFNLRFYHYAQGFYLGKPYPYFRGLIADIGFDAATIEFVQPARKRGITKNNFYTLLDMAMLGFVNNTKIPLRLATMLGFSRLESAF